MAESTHHLSVGLGIAVSEHPSYDMTTPNLSLHSSDATRYVLLPMDVVATSCSPLTPVAQIDGYRRNVEAHGGSLLGIVNSLGPNSLHMAAFANAVNAYARYLRSLPTQFCIGPTNRDAFDALQRSVANSTGVTQRGVSVFEGNLERFANGATPLLSTITQTSHSITNSSRDFTPVANVVARYQAFVMPYHVEVWNLSGRIEGIANALQRTTSEAEQALATALGQIQTNVEAEASTIVQQATNAEAAFRHWQNIDGKVGYERFMDTARFTAQVLVPAFNAFLQLVPATDRIRAAVARAQQALDYIQNNVSSFPSFSPLPSSSSAFPHERYGIEERKYAQARIVDVLRAACSAHFKATGRRLYIGDMQYEHGGRVSPHASHREGRDADVDAVEVGDIPSHDVAAATETAKRFLSAGAEIVFYADATVVNDANEWAQNQGLDGRLQIEASHTRHFHLRVRP